MLFFFPGLFLYTHIKRAQTPKTPDGLTTQAKTPINEKPNPKNPIHDPNPKTPNHHKWTKMRKKMQRVTLGKNIAFVQPFVEMSWYANHKHERFARQNRSKLLHQIGYH